jgi:hypothetical protein
MRTALAAVCAGATWGASSSEECMTDQICRKNLRAVVCRVCLRDEAVLEPVCTLLVSA